VVQGNSGSPVVDLHGQVRGILQEGTDLSSSDSSAAVSMGIKGFGVATNMACINSPADNAYQMPADCLDGDSYDQLKDFTAQQSAASLIDALNPAISVAKEWGKENAPSFQWTLGTAQEQHLLGKKNIYFPQPSCVDLATVSGNRKYKSLLGGLKTSSVSKVNLPIYSVDLGFNEDLVMQMTPTPVDSRVTRLEFNPKDAVDAKKTVFKMSKDSWMSSPFVQGDIAACK
jgi:hypothetical protein